MVKSAVPQPVSVTEAEPPLEHEPVQLPEVGQLQDELFHVTLVGAKLQTFPLPLFVTRKFPPFITRDARVVPTTLMGDVIVVE
jgi:hypothetical protein